MVREQIGKALNTNFNGDKYIKFVHLEQILTTDLIHELLCPTGGYSDAHESFSSTSNDKQIEEAEQTALRTLALCIWTDISPGVFCTLFEHGIRDEHLPLNMGFCHPSIDSVSVDLLLKYQSRFLPYEILDDGAFYRTPSDRPLAMRFEEFDDRVGAGSFSDVFKAEVDIKSNNSCQVAVLLRFPYLC